MADYVTKDTLTLISRRYVHTYNLSDRKKSEIHAAAHIAAQCGNFRNFPPLRKFFVKLIYSKTL